MTECRAVKVEYMYLAAEEEADKNLFISIHKAYDTVHGSMIVLEHDGEVVWFPAAFADVIKDWATGERS